MISKRLYLFVFALLVCISPAYAACDSPNGVEGEVIFNRQWKTMQFCDGEKWIAMGASNTEISAAGDAGQIQYSDGAHNLAASPRLAWDNNQLNIDGNISLSSDSNIRRLIIAGGGASSTQSVVDFYRDNDLRATGLVFRDQSQNVNWHFGHAYRGSSSNDLFLIENASRYDETGTIRLVIQKDTGNVGIGTNHNPTEKLEVNGNVKIAAGNSLLLDLFFVNIALDTATPPTTNGVTCIHSGSYPAIGSTDCSCPTGYMALSGGIGNNIALNRHFRTSRLVTQNTWRYGCTTNSNDRIPCQTITLTCARILPN